MRLTTLSSGSSGNATFIGTKNGGILVDCGLSGKKTIEALESVKVDPKELDGIVVTHEHRDHIAGVGILSRKLDLPVYATEKTWEQLEDQVGQIVQENKRYIEPHSGEEIGQLKVEAFKTSHDAVDPIGLAVYSSSEKVGMATDTGCITSGMNEHMNDCDLLLVEANHDLDLLQHGPYPESLKRRVRGGKGHLENSEIGAALHKWLSGNTQQVVLGHLSQENNRPYLARKTVEDILEKSGVQVGLELQVTVAPREEPHPLVETISLEGLKAV
ncbi:phosphoribosyl 1,2-cyclic phosphodiesterase [Desulfitispora alkaliphila]|uniref:MBL fold metallo-hydrolase n=1 Tax=Desulfitispora alkaliphila TaxID=622674 RepID=UPI003D2486D0